MLASWIDWGNKTPNSYLRKLGNPIQACHKLMNPDGQIVKQLNCRDNLLKPENKNYVHFVNYNDILISLTCLHCCIYIYNAILYFHFHI